MNPKDPKDFIKAKQQVFERSIPFKDAVHRDNERIYVNKRKKCENANTFAHKINHAIVEKEPMIAKMGSSKKHKPNERLYEVAPCVLEHDECTLHSRINAKKDHKQNFKSITKMG